MAVAEQRAREYTPFQKNATVAKINIISVLIFLQS